MSDAPQMEWGDNEGHIQTLAAELDIQHEYFLSIEWSLERVSIVLPLHTISAYFIYSYTVLVKYQNSDLKLSLVMTFFSSNPELCNAQHCSHTKCMSHAWAIQQVQVVSACWAEACSRQRYAGRIDPFINRKVSAQRAGITVAHSKRWAFG